MCSNPGKCGLVIQVGPQSRSSTGISISITSIKSPKAQQYIDLGDHTQIQLATIHSTTCRYMDTFWKGVQLQIHPNMNREENCSFLRQQQLIQASTSIPPPFTHMLTNMCTHANVHVLYLHLLNYIFPTIFLHLSLHFLLFFHLFNATLPEYYFLSLFHSPTPSALYVFFFPLNFSSL